MVVFCPAIESSRSLGMVISVSTRACKLGDALFGLLARACGPSKPNGLVTTPTVSAPHSRATCAMIGAAPVPVPPPMPAVTNTMSASASTSASARDVLERGVAADLGVGAGAEALGERAAEVRS